MSSDGTALKQPIKSECRSESDGRQTFSYIDCIQIMILRPNIVSEMRRK